MKRRKVSYRKWTMGWLRKRQGQPQTWNQLKAVSNLIKLLLAISKIKIINSLWKHRSGAANSQNLNRISTSSLKIGTLRVSEMMKMKAFRTMRKIKAILCYHKDSKMLRMIRRLIWKWHSTCTRIPWKASSSSTAKIQQISLQKCSPQTPTNSKPWRSSQSLEIRLPPQTLNQNQRR